MIIQEQNNLSKVQFVLVTKVSQDGAEEVLINKEHLSESKIFQMVNEEHLQKQKNQQMVNDNKEPDGKLQEVLLIHKEHLQEQKHQQMVDDNKKPDGKLQEVPINKEHLQKQKNQQMVQKSYLPFKSIFLLINIIIVILFFYSIYLVLTTPHLKENIQEFCQNHVFGQQKQQKQQNVTKLLPLFHIDRILPLLKNNNKSKKSYIQMGQSICRSLDNCQLQFEGLPYQIDIYLIQCQYEISNSKFYHNAPRQVQKYKKLLFQCLQDDQYKNNKVLLVMIYLNLGYAYSKNKNYTESVKTLKKGSQQLELLDKSIINERQYQAIQGRFYLRIAFNGFKIQSITKDKFYQYYEFLQKSEQIFGYLIDSQKQNLIKDTYKQAKQVKAKLNY